MTRRTASVLLAAALGACALLALPGLAGGKTEVVALELDGDDGVVLIIDGTDGDDELTIELTEDGLDFIFTDPDGVSAPIPPCVRESATRVRCPAAGVAELDIDLGDGEDVLIVEGVEAEIDVDGEGGDDRLDGGEAPDRMRGGAGRDRLDGDLGADTRHGGPGDDVLEPSAGDDRQIGGQGNDLIAGGTGNDVQLGGPGRDWLKGGPGKDRQDGGAGSDRCAAGAGSVTPHVRCESPRPS